MNLTDALTRWAETTPHAVALIDRARIISYRAFDAAVWRAAAWFRARGVGPGDRIGVSFPGSSAEVVVVIYALARMGAVQMLLPRHEPLLRRRELARRFRLSAVAGDDAAARLDDLPFLAADPDWLAPGKTPVDRSVRVAGGDAPWTINLSSGTTAVAKGVLRSHRDQIILLERLRRPCGDVADQRFLVVVDLGFSFGLRNAMEVWDGGGMVRIARQPLTFANLAVIVDRESINRLALTPGIARSLLEEMSDDVPRFPRLTEMVVSTGAISEGERLAMRHRLTPGLHIVYGTNETLSLARAGPEAQAAFPGTVGFPYEGVEIEIVDDQGRPLPAGETGLVRCRGAGFPTAYLDDPEASAKSFRDGWYYPGDLGRRAPEGALFLMGRADEVINCDGLKIHPAMIEAVLQAHEAVAEAAAFALPSAEFGEIPAAAVVLRAPVPGLLAFCRERLGARAPRALHVLEALPRNAIGKVAKRELVTRLSQAKDAAPGEG